MKMNTCCVMKAEALASVPTELRRSSFLAPSLGEKPMKVRVELGKQRAENLRTTVCRASEGGSKSVFQGQSAFDSPSSAKGLYQPFRPPITIQVPEGARTTEDQLEILRERRGLWHEYATLIPILARSGYTPSMIDEETGMTGVEQNIIVVASQVRNSLKASGFDESKLEFFDLGGGELLYELRILSAAQRKASAEFIMERKMSPKEACELARSVKDFSSRKNMPGFKDFTSAPGDCLAFAFYRQSTEFQNKDDVVAALEKALEVCVSDKAKAKIEQTLKAQSTPAEEPEVAESVFLQVIRLLESDPVGTKLPTMLPVADATADSLEQVPAVSAQGQGVFNVFSTTVWPSWVPVPGWDNVVGAGAPVALNFPDASKLPLKSNKNGVAKLVEPTLVIVDKSVTQVDDSQSLYVVAQGDGQELSLLAPSKILEGRVLGRVLLALRPPVPPSEAPIEWD